MQTEDKNSLKFLTGFYYALSIGVCIYFLRFYSNTSWIRSIIYGSITGFGFVLLWFHLPTKILFLHIANHHDEKFEQLKQEIGAIDKTLMSDTIFVAIYFGYKCWKSIDLLHVPQIGEKLCLSEMSDKELGSHNLDNSTLKKLEEGYVWTVDKVICYPHRYVTLITGRRLFCKDYIEMTVS